MGFLSEALKNLLNKSHHRVLVCAAHSLSALSFDSEEREEVIGRTKCACVLNRLGPHAITFLANVHPPETQRKQDFVE